MLHIGVTGGIGAGKSTVCRVFEILGIPVFYADEESKQLLSDPIVKLEVMKLLGVNVYLDEVADRKKIAHIVFNNKETLKSFNAIMHPAVNRRFKSWLYQQRDVPYIIKEAALIFETGIEKDLNKVIVVAAHMDLRIRRIQGRDGITEEQVLLRMQNQWPQEEKIRLADFIINNNDEQPIIPQVLTLHEKLTAMAQAI
ncbi:MAG: dephospho-CoA kinase [Chitinophagales bacterium]|nr:dephospho-CoA kinase [Chitinophagales bacterium]